MTRCTFRRAAGGSGAALRVDHLDPAQVEVLVARIESDAGRLDILVNDILGGTEATWRDALERVLHFCISGSPTYVGRGIAAFCADPDRRRYAGRVLSSAELARLYGITDTDGPQPDCWRYVVEIEGPGLPARELGYRSQRRRGQGTMPRWEGGEL